MKKVLKNKKAFTLTEMIVVIAIIGILAGVLIPTITGYIKRANQSAAYQEAEAVLNIYETWQTEAEAGLTVDQYFESYYEEIVGKEVPTNVFIKVTGISSSSADAKSLYYVDGDIVVVIDLVSKDVDYLTTNPIPNDATERIAQGFFNIGNIEYK